MAPGPPRGRQVLHINLLDPTADPGPTGFSPYNCPHLTPALELDDCIIEFSTDLASRGLPTLITSQADIDTLTTALKERIATLNLWQYYIINPASEKAAVLAAVSASPPKITPWTGEDIAGKTVAELAPIIRAAGKLQNVGKFSKRFGISVDPAVAAGIVKAAFTELGDATPETYAEAWVRVVDVLNVDHYKEWEEDTKVAMDNIVNRVKYTRLDDNGPKVGEITSMYVCPTLPPAHTLTQRLFL